jgi:hypothetical protein
VEILIVILCCSYPVRIGGELFDRKTSRNETSHEFTKNTHFLGLAIFIGLISIMNFAPDQNCAGADQGQQVLIYDDGTAIRVPVKIFGETRYFLLDTGFTVSAIDRQYEQSLGEAITQYRVSTPLAASEALPVYHSPEIVLGGKQLAFDKIACLDLTMARLISGQPCDGVLGMDFFAKNIFSVDFDKKILSWSAKVPATVEGTAVVIPLNRTD